ncbi:MAG: hypothetical protein IKX76_04060, partial [Eubacterium sp.]|nr:hypothetical protein [Eubacterium sp.]
GLHDEIERAMGVPVETENHLEIDDENGTYTIYKIIRTVIDEEKDEVSRDAEILEEGRLADVTN